MMQRILHSRGFVSALLAMVAGTVLYYTYPFPSDQIFLRVTAIRAPRAFLSFEYLYNLFLFTTPFLLFSTVLSGLYIFTLKVRHHISPGHLPKYIAPEQRDGLYVVVGEVHNPRRPGPSEAPQWLSIPERGLFTGIAIDTMVACPLRSTRVATCLPFGVSNAARCAPGWVSAATAR